MERLTVKREDGRWALANNDGSSPMRQIEKLPVAIDRLAAYEDTGLTPEEVKALVQTPNDPLTLEELREMDGEPVWVEIPINMVSEWCIAKFDPLMNRVRLWCSGGGWFDGRNVGKSLFVYRRKPKELEGGIEVC